MHAGIDVAALSGMATVARSGARRKRPVAADRHRPDAEWTIARPPEVLPPPELSLDQLAAGWRGAFDAADAALRAAASDSLPAEEVTTQNRQLVAERAATLELLRAVARERGVPTRFLHLVPRRDLRRVLDLPPTVTACVFELDGVLVASAELHIAAWEQTFDEFLLQRSAMGGELAAPFHPTDYRQHVHGKPRFAGVVDFLASRGISLPLGEPGDAPGAHTVHGLANRKNEILLHLIDVRGVRSFEDSRHYLETAVEAGLTTAVVSASANSERILARTGLGDLVDASVDGRTMVAEHLLKRPAPDVLLAACRMAGAEPAAAAAFETTPEGVAAARAADFAVVVAVDRGGRSPALHAAGADVVTSDLGTLLERRLAA